MSKTTRVILSALLAGGILLGLSFAVLFITIKFFPNLAEEYYNPVFYPGRDRIVLYYFHPFVLGMALSWLWERFKPYFNGAKWLQGLKFGAIYALVATLPSMWITFSAISVTLLMVGMWFFYGLFQASIAGLIFAWVNPKVRAAQT
ncbi:MAG: hypothetical protein R3350_08635 [Saprospiraceae bacterium]|nr:hypothetical protein [Saprospiraceae bacterium]